MEEDFRALLLAAAGVTNIVGTRVEWGSLGQGVSLPAVLLTLIDGAEGMTHEGPDGLTSARVQVDCYADNIGTAIVLRRAVIAALNGHKDANFQGVFHEGTRSTREGGTNEASRPYRESLDFEAHWRADT